eukprot:7478045-Pyramimonas_sp.AAC.1
MRHKKNHRVQPQLPSDEGTTHVPKRAAQPPPGASGHPEIHETDAGTEDFCVQRSHTIMIPSF